ncbi:MAG: T9SS type A sorting domain-containing protein [Bacteroidetes bacterium]|nr:T9SS type A sorting domain-containing protein [Bacteroidota bacterium]
MKTKFTLFTLAFVFASFFSAKAQITIDGITSSKIVLTDTFIKANNKDDFAMMGKAATNATWDVSTATNTSAFLWAREAANSTTFTDASFEKDIFYAFAGGLSYTSTQYVKISGNGLASQGEEIKDEQVIPLTALTGGANDNLTFPVQTIVYTSGIKEQKFPMTYGDVFTSSNSRSTKFNITVAAFGLNNVQGVRKTFYNTTDSVVGWGSVKVKHRNTGLTYNIPVLQVSHRVVVVDSFYLGGAPAPAQMLAAFGLSQNNTVNDRTMKFFRKDEVNPLIAIEYADATSATIDRFDIVQDRLEENSVGIEVLNALAAEIKVYPNPVNDNQFTIDRPAQNGNWSFEISDIYGRAIQTGELGEFTTLINVNDLASGRYIVRVLLNNQPVGEGMFLSKQ